MTILRDIDCAAQQSGSSTNLLERAFERMPVAMVMVDRRGEIAMVNLEAEKVFGYARDELIGQMVEKLVPAHCFHAMHPGYRNGFFAEPKARHMGASRDLFGRRKDGSEFPVEIGLNPIETEKGPMVLSAIVDITVRRRSERRFQQVVESAVNAMVMVDKAGVIAMVNAQTEKLFGYARTELLGKTMDMLVPERFRGGHPAKRQGFFAEPKARAMGAGRDLYALRKDGSEFPVEIGLNPIETEEGPMVLSAIVDITKRKQRDERIRVAMQEKDLLLGEIHHRVKNNLQIIDSLLDLQVSRIDDPAVQMMLRDSQNRIRSMSLIHQTLYQSNDFARVDFQRFIGQLAPVLMESYASGAGRVEMHVDAQRVELPINVAIPCGLMVNELVTNALKHGFPGMTEGNIWVELKQQQPDEVVLTVSNDGIPIATELDFAGMATLGMQLVNLLAQQIKGRLEGTALGTDAIRRLLSGREIRMNAPIKVMVVEDESIVAFNLQQRLSQLGYDASAVAASGTDALRLADETNPDLVLMDIRIQGDMDGIEVATHLNVSHPLPVIYLTAHSEDATIARARTTRPYGYLLKPFSDREMHATILMALERRKVEVELRDSEERLRLALDAAAMGVWDMDADTRSVTISDKSIDILGLTGPSPVRYEHLLECVEQADRERVAAEFERCLAQLAPYRVEFRSTAGDDDKRWVRFEARPRTDRRVIGVVQNISKRKLAEEALRELHETLEAQVADRTAELRRSVGELDTFSYSIAHDLRAPLRSIIGFSQMLLKDHGASLDATGKRFLGKVSAAGTHMGQLIDGLLNLSRLTRSHMSRNEVNMSAIATTIAQQLLDADPRRRVNFIVAPGLTAYVDKVLIGDLLDNVFRNAWKFTSKHPAARIEFGVRQIDGETVYFVSDDGAGFDMTYADHLFRPFHRLHRSDEFEGTGIGLATVQRIVERHGGRIWAEAAVEKGTTFYFTLAPQEPLNKSKRPAVF